MSGSVVLVLVSVAATALLCALAWRRPSRNAAVAQCVTANTAEPAERGWTAVADLDDDLIEMVLTMHYRQLLADPAGQRVVRKMFAQAAAVRTVRNLGR